MGQKLPSPGARSRTQTATVLSVGTPTLIGAALRVARRKADRTELAQARAPLARLADRDPAAALVADWLDAKLALMDRQASDRPCDDPVVSDIPVAGHRASGEEA